MADFDALVREGEARADAEPTDEERRARAIEAEMARKKSLLRSSLTFSRVAAPFGIVGAMLLGIGALVLAAKGLHLDLGTSQVVALVFIVGYPLLLWWAVRRVEGWWARRQIQSLRALPIPLGVDGYLSTLGRQHSSTTPKVRLRFAGPLTDAARHEIEAAAESERSVEKSEWQGDTLSITGPRLQSEWRPDENRPVRHNNGRAHLWVRRYLKRVVVVIHRRHPLAAVGVGL